MAVQLTFQVPGQCAPTLAVHARSLAASWGTRTGASTHAEAAAAIAVRHFAGWGERPLTLAERGRVEDYFRAVLRRRIVSGLDRDARAARSRLVARSIEEDLIGAGWDPARASLQASDAVGIALSA